MTSEESYGGALYVPWADADTKGITTEAASRALAEAGLPVSKASAFFRNCAATLAVTTYVVAEMERRLPFGKPEKKDGGK